MCEREREREEPSNEKILEAKGKCDILLRSDTVRGILSFIVRLVLWCAEMKLELGVRIEIEHSNFNSYVSLALRK